MSSYDKLILEIKNLNRTIRFEELSKVLERIGYRPKAPKGGSSHVTFRKNGKYPITIPKGYPVNKAYIDLVRDAVSRYESEALEND
jgi:predicted RNA binding protein YcfA (HicA-like mRNA interferase family)